MRREVETALGFRVTKETVGPVSGHTSYDRYMVNVLNDKGEVERVYPGDHAHWKAYQLLLTPQSEWVTGE